MVEHLDEETFATNFALWKDRIPFAPELDETIRLYWRYVKQRLTKEEFLEASEKLFTTWTERRFPSPREIVELAKPRSATVDFVRLWQSIRHGKEEWSAVYFDLPQQSQRTARTMGGYTRFSMTNPADRRWLQKEFEELYDLDPALERRRLTTSEPVRMIPVAGDMAGDDTR